MKNGMKAVLLAGLLFGLQAQAQGGVAWDKVPTEGLPLSAKSIPAPPPGSNLVAPEMPFVLDSAVAGVWSDDGAWAVWRAIVTTADAKSLSMRAKVELPLGATLRITDSNGTGFQTVDGPRTGNLYTVAVPGAIARLEIRVPSSKKAEVSMQVDKLFVGITRSAAPSVQPSFADKLFAPAAVATSQPQATASPPAGAENFDCYDNSTTANAGKSTVMYTVYLPDGGLGSSKVSPPGTYQCSATLIDNTSHDNDPLLVTAAHCAYSGDKKATSIDPASFTVYWNRQAACSTTAADGGIVDALALPGPTTSGVTPLASIVAEFIAPSTGQPASNGPYYDFGDGYLVRLDTPPPAGSAAYFAGFDVMVPNYSLPPDPSRPPVNTTCYQNPKGQYFCDPEASSGTPATSFNVNHSGGYSKQYSASNQSLLVSFTGWQQIVSVGAVSPGSSGSGLFDSNQRWLGPIYGTLSYTDGRSYDVFSSGWYAWEGNGTPDTRLKDWLDPQSTGVKVIDGHVAPIPPSVTLSGDRTSATAGQSATLSWSSSDAASCTASNAWSGTKALNGSQAVSLPSAGAYTYTLTCMNQAGQSAAQSVTISVTSPAPPPSPGPTPAPSSGGSSGGGAFGVLPMLLFGVLAMFRRRR